MHARKLETDLHIPVQPVVDHQAVRHPDAVRLFVLRMRLWCGGLGSGVRNRASTYIHILT